MKYMDLITVIFLVLSMAISGISVVYFAKYGDPSVIPVLYFAMMCVIGSITSVLIDDSRQNRTTCEIH